MSVQGDDPAALALLCRDYWFPLYCYARRLTVSAEEAEDLTQGFFASLLARDGLKSVTAERGKLRSFLLTGLKNHAAEVHRHGCAQKRGGGAAMVEFDALEAEQRYALEPRSNLTPEREFDRAWARQLLAAVLERLRMAYAEAGKGAIFEALQSHLTGSGSEDYESAEKTLGISAAAVRFAAFKLRERYRTMLREAIAETVESPAEVEAELVHLREIFSL